MVTGASCCTPILSPRLARYLTIGPPFPVFAAQQEQPGSVITNSFLHHKYALSRSHIDTLTLFSLLYTNRLSLLSVSVIQPPLFCVAPIISHDPVGLPLSALCTLFDKHAAAKAVILLTIYLLTYLTYLPYYMQPSTRLTASRVPVARPLCFTEALGVAVNTSVLGKHV